MFKIDFLFAENLTVIYRLCDGYWLRIHVFTHIASSDEIKRITRP